MVVEAPDYYFTPHSQLSTPPSLDAEGKLELPKALLFRAIVHLQKVIPSFYGLST